jgi:hypothetical protein
MQDSSLSEKYLKVICEVSLSTLVVFRARSTIPSETWAKVT